jgi:putative ABC transport system permease protein
VRGGAQAVYGNNNWATLLQGVSADFLDARDWEVANGRSFLHEELESAGKVVLLGETVARNLFGASDPIGQVVRVQKIPLRVVGVLAHKGQNTEGQDQDDTVVVPLTTAKNRILGASPPHLRSVNSVLVKVRDGEDFDETEQQIRNLLRQRHRLHASRPDDFIMKNLSEIMERRDESAQTLTLLLAAVASVSLVVGGIGVMNIMLVSVTERTREIGLRLAIGARQKDVLVQFLIEAVLLAVIGGAMGIGLGALAATVIAGMADWPTIVRAEAIVIAAGCSIAIGVFFGFYPARRAARLDPIVALRHE